MTFLVCVAGLTAFSGCVNSVLAKKLVQAPNRQMPVPWSDEKSVKAFATVISESFTVPVGPPAAKLAVAIVEPGDYGLRHELTVKPEGDGNSFSFNVNFRWDQPKPDAAPVPTKGTIVLLHGIFTSKETMLHWALYLAEAGYRAVLVDLRGHGRSTGKWITYGRAEAQDLVQVTDELTRRGLAQGHVGVLGISYGAVMGIHWASIDPRVKSLVAIQPYSDVGAAILGVARGNFGEIAKAFSDETFAKAIAAAPARAGFNWTDVEVLPAVRRLGIPLLIYHGRKDNWVLPRHSEEIAAVAPKGSQLGLLDNDHHLTLSVRLDPIAPDVLKWLNRGLVQTPVQMAEGSAAGTAGAAPSL